MILDGPAFDEDFEIGRQFRDLQARDITQLHEGMRSDVAAATRAAGFLGIDAPGGLLLTGIFELGGEPALEVIGINPADIAEHTCADDVAAKPGRPMAEVGM